MSHDLCQWRRQDFVTVGSEVWVNRGSRVRSPLVPVVLSVYQRGSLLDGLVICICGVIRRSSMTMKAHTYYIIFGRPHIGEASPFPLAAPLVTNEDVCFRNTRRAAQGSL